jgi:hypothetical protein
VASSLPFEMQSLFHWGSAVLLPGRRPYRPEANPESSGCSSNAVVLKTSQQVVNYFFFACPVEFPTGRDYSTGVFSKFPPFRDNLLPYFLLDIVSCFSL